MMKNLLLPAFLLTGTGSVCAAAGTDLRAEDDSLNLVLEQIEVVANRATAKTPVAFTNVGKKELLRNNDATAT